MKKTPALTNYQKHVIEALHEVASPRVSNAQIRRAVREVRNDPTFYTRKIFGPVIASGPFSAARFAIGYVY